MSDKDSKGGLLPCPFCGIEPIRQKKYEMRGGRPGWRTFVLCEKCFTCLPIRTWNTRPTPKEEWISVKTDRELLLWIRDWLWNNEESEGNPIAGRQIGTVFSILKAYEALPSPPTDQTEKKC